MLDLPNAGPAFRDGVMLSGGARRRTAPLGRLFAGYLCNDRPGG
jgi:hypothetical protein